MCQRKATFSASGLSGALAHLVRNAELAAAQLLLELVEIVWVLHFNVEGLESACTHYVFTAKLACRCRMCPWTHAPLQPYPTHDKLRMLPPHGTATKCNYSIKLMQDQA